MPELQTQSYSLQNLPQHDDFIRSINLLKSALQKQMNTGIVYGNIVIQFRYFFVFGVFAKHLKTGLAKALSPALGGNNNICQVMPFVRIVMIGRFSHK